MPSPKLDPEISRALTERFGFSALRTGQTEVISSLLDGRSALAVFPTGGGKSLCYQLPAVVLPGLTLVISPLIALMKDQIDFLRAHGIAASRLDSSVPVAETAEVWASMRRGELDLLYIAPERFQNERFMARLDGIRISLMAIDEAHCISEWGHNFRPDYLKLARVATRLGVERVLALTATATPAVARDITAAFDIAEGDHISTGFHRSNLFLRLTPVARGDRDAHLVGRLRAQHPGATIVYVTLQGTAERVTTLLKDAGFDAHCYHAGLDAEVRHQIQETFMASDHAIIVATIAFGMGIDKADIRNVYHYNLPKALENYAQEIGRAGRDGSPATCELLVCADDAVTLENFSYGDTPTPEAVHSFVHDVLSRGETFDVSRYDLSNRHDVRSLVVGTLLTYLELEGVISATGPFYDTYKFQPKRSSEEILADYGGEEATFMRALLARSKKAKTWFTIDLSAAAERLGAPRARCVAALDRLQESGALDIKVTGLRHGYRVASAPPDLDGLAASLAERFAAAEARDIARTERVLALARHRDCVVRELLKYFGEALGGPCGHCDRCAGEAITTIPERTPSRFTAQDAANIEEVRDMGHECLHSPRQLTRFLCGLPSPAASRVRPSLRRHPMFGKYADVPFGEVLAFASSSTEESPSDASG